MADTKFAIRVSLDGGSSVEDGLRRIAEAASNMSAKAGQAGAATGSAFAGTGQQIQQVGYQVGDFAVQVASGQSALVAFTQQGAQLAGMFGPGGAVAGAGLAIGAIALQFLLGKSAAEQFAEALKTTGELYKAASEGAERYRTGLAAEGEQIRQLTTYYGQLSEARREAERVAIEAARRQLNEQAGELRGNVTSGALGRIRRSMMAEAAMSGDELAGVQAGVPAFGEELPAAVRTAMAALRDFEKAGDLSREGVARLIARLEEARAAGGGFSEAIRKAIEQVLAQVGAVGEFEDAQRRLAGQSEALKGNAEGAAAAIGGLGAAARAQEGAFDVLNRGLTNANALLTAFRAGGAGALQDARQAIDLETRARASRETQIGELMQRQGLSRQDAETRARADDAERYRILRETAAAGTALTGEQAVTDSRERRAEAKRLAAVGIRERPIEQARINAEREAREKHLGVLQAEELVRNRVAAARAAQDGAAGKGLATTRAQTEAALQAVAAAEQGRVAYMRAAAAINAAGQVAGGAAGGVAALAEAALNRAAAQEATRGAEAVLNMREQLAAARELAAAETPREVAAAKLNESIRQATAGMRAYAEATTNPGIREALTKEADAIERMMRDAKLLEDTTRNRAALYQQGATLARQELERSTAGLEPRERARVLAEAAERQRIEGEPGGDPGSAEARERIQRAGQIGVGDEDIRRLKEFQGAASEAGRALSDAFRQAAFEGKSLNDVMKNLLTSLSNIAWRSLVEKPIESAFSQMAGSLMSGASKSGGSGGGVFGSIIGSLFGGGADGGMKSNWSAPVEAHGGGIVGHGLVPRAAPAGAWHGAPRYHAGGIAGLGPDEVPAILLRGERVRTQGQEAALQRSLAARRGSGSVTMHIHGVRDADSFHASRGQIIAGMARTLRQSQRNS